MSYERLNPTDSTIYDAVNSYRDTSWWVGNNTVWKAIDWLANSSQMQQRIQVDSGTIASGTQSATITATVPCVVYVSAHISANTNGRYKATLNSKVLHLIESNGSTNSIFGTSYFMAPNDTLVINTESNASSSYVVMGINSKLR